MSGLDFTEDGTGKGGLIEQLYARIDKLEKENAKLNAIIGGLIHEVEGKDDIIKDQSQKIEKAIAECKYAQLNMTRLPTKKLLEILEGKEGK